MPIDVNQNDLASLGSKLQRDVNEEDKEEDDGIDFDEEGATTPNRSSSDIVAEAAAASAVHAVSAESDRENVSDLVKICL